MPHMTTLGILEWICYRICLWWPVSWPCPDWLVTGAMDYIDDVMREPDRLAREMLRLRRMRR